MRAYSVPVLPALMIGVLACASAPRAAPPKDAAPLRVADGAMAQALAAGDLDRFARHVDQEAIWGGPAAFLRGRDSVVAAWRRYGVPGGPRLTWAPTDAAISAEGDLGYTVGTYRLEARDHRGAPVAADGRYVTVWRSGRDGIPRALFDLELLTPSTPPEDRRPLAAVTSAGRDLRAEVGTWAGSGGARGTYLVVWRRSPDGVEVPVVESVVPSGR